MNDLEMYQHRLILETWHQAKDQVAEDFIQYSAICIKWKQGKNSGFKKEFNFQEKLVS